MTVQVGPNLGAGGATTFVFDRGEVFGWRMIDPGLRASGSWIRCCRTKSRT